jgi:hypothetical protein
MCGRGRLARVFPIAAPAAASRDHISSEKGNTRGDYGREPGIGQSDCRGDGIRRGDCRRVLDDQIELALADTSLSTVGRLQAVREVVENYKHLTGKVQIDCRRA